MKAHTHKWKLITRTCTRSGRLVRLRIIVMSFTRSDSIRRSIIIWLILPTHYWLCTLSRRWCRRRRHLIHAILDHHRQAHWLFWVSCSLLLTTTGQSGLSIIVTESSDNENYRVLRPIFSTSFTTSENVKFCVLCVCEIIKGRSKGRWAKYLFCLAKGQRCEWTHFTIFASHFSCFYTDCLFFRLLGTHRHTLAHSFSSTHTHTHTRQKMSH